MLDTTTNIVLGSHNETIAARQALLDADTRYRTVCAQVAKLLEKRDQAYLARCKARDILEDHFGITGSIESVVAGLR